MNVVVCIKRVPATDSRVKIADDGTSLDSAQVEWIISPYDEFAVEAALQLKEAAGEGSVTIMSMGPAAATKELRTCLAMGADDAVLLLDEEHGRRDAATTAAVLAEAIKARSPDLVLCGKQAVDLDQGEVGSRLAAHLGWPLATEIRKLDVADGKATIERAGEDGTSEIWELPLPAVLTATKGLNDPRYASLKGIMKAKKKPLDQSDAALGETRLEVRSLELPPPRREGRIVGEGAEAVPELVRLLREEAKVL
ncbi:MAG: electron transfer flavoprotein subunit beta [Planctomycetota bacterium]|nr:MAG: electron transfer flavoprotein subunit beta [Planctomycetota bacterium]